MTESDTKTVEFSRLVRLLRKLLIGSGVDLGAVAVEIIARGIVDQLINRFVPANAPQGDIGCCTDEDIAEGLGWLGDATQFVDALVESGRLIRHPKYRLLVANWHRLAPAYLRSNVKHVGGFIAPEAGRVRSAPDADDLQTEPTAPRNDDRYDCPNGDRCGGRYEDRNDGLVPPVLSNPSHSPPTLPFPSIDPIDGDGSIIPDEGANMLIDQELYERIKPDCNRIRKLVRPGEKPLTEDDRQSVGQCVAIVTEHLPPRSLDRIVKDIERSFKRREPDTSRIAYFIGAVQNACQDCGVDFHGLKKRYGIPPRAQEAAPVA